MYIHTQFYVLTKGSKRWTERERERTSGWSSEQNFNRVHKTDNKHTHAYTLPTHTLITFLYMPVHKCACA